MTIDQKKMTNPCKNGGYRLFLLANRMVRGRWTLLTREAESVLLAMRLHSLRQLPGKRSNFSIGYPLVSDGGNRDKFRNRHKLLMI